MNDTRTPPTLVGTGRGLRRLLMGPLIAVPANAGYPRAPGLRLGPASIVAQLDRRGADVVRPDLGDGSVAAVTAGVGEAVARAAAAGRVPVVIGGDHTVALGGVCGVRAGLRRREGRPAPLFLLWLDAHPDANTEQTSPTGHRHGMVLAGLLGEGPLAVVEPLPAAHVVVAGARAFDPGELAFLRARPELTLWDVETLRGGAWRAPVEALLARVARAGGRLYVSLDLDVLDPAVAPGVAVPAPRGALPGPLLALLRRLRVSGLVAGADVVELYPPADEEDRTAVIAADALCALGAARRVRPRPEPIASLRLPAAADSVPPLGRASVPPAIGA